MLEETGSGVEEIANGIAGRCGDVVQVLGLVEAGTGGTRLAFTRGDLNTSRLSDGNLRCVRGIQDLGSAVERVVVELVSSSSTRELCRINSIVVGEKVKCCEHRGEIGVIAD